MALVLSSNMFNDSRGLSLVFPLGSPICAVAPPIRAMTLCPAFRKCNSPIIASKLPTCRLSAVGSNPQYTVCQPDCNNRGSSPCAASSGKAFCKTPRLFRCTSSSPVSVTERRNVCREVIHASGFFKIVQEPCSRDAQVKHLAMDAAILETMTHTPNRKLD
ncbi:hypothetical protein DPEC_G00217060 [Dallia pectoralis]|uniref:Uncharacterized protein n=1 Tax=Dallia pectoralis TaxID=75939 RepID=A0ACC2G342_DALPE|nr:hypothetical protein DPEC_G00217060 [Dallia pectoralis]